MSPPFEPDYDDCTDHSSSSGDSDVTVIEVHGDSASRYVAASGSVLSVSVPACGRSVAATPGADVSSLSLSVSSVPSGSAGSHSPPAVSDPAGPGSPQPRPWEIPYSTPDPSQLSFPGLEDWVPEREVSVF